MIDIYDELGYIKNVLSNGLSLKWERDAILLVRYYKMEGVKKSEAKKRIQQKCEEASRRVEDKKNNILPPIAYNHLVSYKRLNKIVDGAWKKETPLRAIHGVTIPREVVDWFLNLENSTSLSSDEVAYYKKRRPSIVIKHNNPMNWNRVKYLFTLYIWSKIQENYLERPNVHYLKKYYKRFKEDAKLPPSFSMQKERDFLYDLGYIDINYALGIETVFMSKFDVFNTPITEENAVFIPTGEPETGDLYHPGYWLEKQKMGSFICQCCGKEFANYTKYTKGRPRKYCKECAEKLEHGSESHIKQLEVNGFKNLRFCEQCGNSYELISPLDLKSTLCPECKKIHVRELTKARVAKYRDKTINETSEI